MLAGLVSLAGVIPAANAGNSEDNFAVLAGTTVTSAGATVLNGNVGDYPGATITIGAGGVVNGRTYAGGSVSLQAQLDALSAYAALSAESPGQNLTGENLGGLTLTPGVYDFTAAALLTGTLTLNAQGNPNAQFVFQVASTLTTANNSSVILADGAQAGNVSWQIGTSATLGSGTVFDGSVLANTSITLDGGASLSGRAVALNGAVSLNDNNISVPSVSSVPEPNSFVSGALCAALVGAGLGLNKWWRPHHSVRSRFAGAECRIILWNQTSELPGGPPPPNHR